MNQEVQDNLIYGLFLAAIFLAYLWRYHHKQSSNIRLLEQNKQAGLMQPSSLHPKIDSRKCIGAGSCVSACPEGNVIGLIHGKAELINPTKCIGHGACKAACPIDAISLVFGTETRGVEIPEIDENFQSNIPGIYIAGELGGMGLIRNSLEQGKQAMEAIAKNCGNNTGDMLDVLIIGAGPAGLAASLGAMEKKLNYVTLEQDSLGGTIAHYPRGKIVMTSPVTVPVIGKIKFGETTKEKLISFWEKVEQDTGIKINYHERMEDIKPRNIGFEVKSSKASYQAKNILLAMGRRGTPRKLGVPGEDKTKVVYRLIDPAQYAGHHVLVVGGGDSALEAAVTIAEQPDSTVSISYRSAAFSRAKQKNRDKIQVAENQGKINVLLSSNVKEITETTVVIIDQNKQELELKNTAVIVCAGGIPPTPFLKKIGVSVEEKFGTE